MPHDPHEEYMKRAVEGTFEKLSDSKIFLALFTKAYQKDPVALMQLGMAVVLDKPILLVVKRGTPIPDNVRRLARAIEEFDSPDDVGLATQRLIKRMENLVA